MIIKVNGKNITVSDKNARAYGKLNGIPLDAAAVKIYISSTYHKDVDEIIVSSKEAEISKLVNECIETEVRGCGGDLFYEEA